MSDRLISTRQACRATGATTRQLQYWVKIGLVMPTVRSAGAGSWNLWGSDAVEDVQKIVSMLWNGMTLHQVRRQRAVSEVMPEAKVTYTSSQIAALDKLAGDIVRDRGYCEAALEGCMGSGLQWAHIRRRRFMATRWDLDNALALCQSCHDWADSSKANMQQLVGERYDALRERSLKSATRSTAELREGLRAAARSVE